MGKRAFPRVLGAMASIRDRLTDEDTLEERLLESSLYLADMCLRAMDGYLEEHNVQPLRPGTGRKDVEFVCILHFKRWIQVLKDLDEMPGPYDPARDAECVK
jgi:hypothetical protein